MNIATVAAGWSHYDDRVYNWIGKRHVCFGDEKEERVTRGFDYASAWPILLLVGCEITRESIAPAEYDCADESLVSITFNDTIEELIRRLDACWAEYTGPKGDVDAYFKWVEESSKDDIFQGDTSLELIALEKSEENK